MKIVVRAYYRERPLIGYVRVSQIVGLQPKQYKLSIYREDKGPIEINKNYFPTHESAMDHASLYGFSSNKWEIDEKDIS